MSIGWIDGSKSVHVIVRQTVDEPLVVQRQSSQAAREMPFARRPQYRSATPRQPFQPFHPEVAPPNFRGASRLAGRRDTSTPPNPPPFPSHPHRPSLLPFESKVLPSLSLCHPARLFFVSDTFRSSPFPHHTSITSNLHSTTPESTKALTTTRSLSSNSLSLASCAPPASQPTSTRQLHLRASLARVLTVLPPSTLLSGCELTTGQ
jgi:hypothetical protein